ncbi:MAG: SPFH/Band 7/PHB domain protein [Clostridia bacterium]|nr:SPFH/Band 7/PHB domain protein [Clostridia bacterium]
MPFLIAGFFLLIIFFLKQVRVVPQTQVYVIERFGKYRCQWQAGLHIKAPFIDRIARKVSLKEQVLDFPPQPVITKDNVTMQIDSIVFMRVQDPKLFTYGVENPIEGVGALTATTLRNLVGNMTLDDTLTSRDNINGQMSTILDEATDPWGIKVTRVELKNIIPPAEIEEVMTKQMRAEREKRQAILEAEAHQQSVTMRAEGDKRAAILDAEADRESDIARAHGRAESIRLVYEAEADGIRKLAEAGMTPEVLALKQLDALKAVADGNATKIFMPTDLADSVGKMGMFSDALGTMNKDGAKKVPPKVERKVDACAKSQSSQVTKRIVEDRGQVVNDAEDKTAGR